MCSKSYMGMMLVAFLSTPVPADDAVQITPDQRRAYAESYTADELIRFSLMQLLIGPEEVSARTDGGIIRIETAELGLTGRTAYIGLYRLGNRGQLALEQRVTLELGEPVLFSGVPPGSYWVMGIPWAEGHSLAAADHDFTDSSWHYSYVERFSSRIAILADSWPSFVSVTDESDQRIELIAIEKPRPVFFLEHLGRLFGEHGRGRYRFEVNPVSFNIMSYFNKGASRDNDSDAKKAWMTFGYERAGSYSRFVPQEKAYPHSSYGVVLQRRTLVADGLFMAYEGLPFPSWDEAIPYEQTVSSIFDADQRTGALCGYIIDQHGKPVSGGRIFLIHNDSRLSIHYPVFNDTGEFLIERIPPLRYSVQFIHEKRDYFYGGRYFPIDQDSFIGGPTKYSAEVAEGDIAEPINVVVDRLAQFYAKGRWEGDEPGVDVVWLMRFETSAPTTEPSEWLDWTASPVSGFQKTYLLGRIDENGVVRFPLKRSDLAHIERNDGGVVTVHLMDEARTRVGETHIDELSRDVASPHVISLS